MIEVVCGGCGHGQIEVAAASHKSALERILSTAEEKCVVAA